MNQLSATEILTLSHASSASPEVSYAPVWISTDKRISDPEKTTMKYAQIGGPLASDKIGNAYGPIYMIEFVDLSAVSATHIKILGIDNDELNAPIYPISYILDNPKLYIWLDKFDFVDSLGNTVAPGGTYTIFGHRKRQFPVQY